MSPMMPIQCPFCGLRPVLRVPETLPLLITAHDRTQKYDITVFVCPEHGHIFMIPAAELTDKPTDPFA